MNNLTFQQRKEIYKMERRARLVNEVRAYVLLLIIFCFSTMDIVITTSYREPLLGIYAVFFILIIRDKVVPSIYDTPRPDVG